MIRKTIAFSESDFGIINSYAKEKGYSFSDMTKRALFDFIGKDKPLSLSEQLNLTYDFATPEEQAEFDKMEIDNITGREITIDEIVQGNI